MPFGKAIVSFILYGKAGNPAICKIFSFIFGTRHVLLSVQDDKMRYGFILISNEVNLIYVRTQSNQTGQKYQTQLF